MNPSDDPVALGRAALERGDWTGARRQFETAIHRQETGPALDGLSDALFWLGELETSLHHRSRAFGMYREGGDLCRAARAALWLAMGYISGYGNAAAANGWLQRAERLLDEAGPCAERGWFEQLRGKMTPDPAATARHARPSGRDRAAAPRCRSGSVGFIRRGSCARRPWGGWMRAWRCWMRRWRPRRPETHAICSLSAMPAATCSRPAIARPISLVQCSGVRSLTNSPVVYHCPPVFNYCRVVYSGILIATGRWDEAEEELKTALRTVEHAYPQEKVHSLSRLALLCVRRGRFEEASQLLTGLETHGLATEASALLHLAQGEAALASALLERRIEALGDGLPAVPLLRLLVDARLSTGEIQQGKLAASRLLAIAERANRPPIQAMAFLATGASPARLRRSGARHVRESVEPVR